MRHTVGLKTALSLERMASSKPEKKALFTFGRFQPPTVSHGTLFRELAAKAAAEGADAFAFASSSQDKKKNPLSVDRKVAWIETIYGGLPVRFVNTTTCRLTPLSPSGRPCKTIFAIVDALRSAGYTQLTLLVGTDRVAGFTEMFGKYSAPGVAPVKVIGSSTVRTAESVSGTQMRNAAIREDKDAFKRGTGLEDANAAALIAELQAAMKGGRTLKKMKRQRTTRKYKESRKRSPWLK